MDGGRLLSRLVNVHNELDSKITNQLCLDGRIGLDRYGRQVNHASQCSIRL